MSERDFIDFSADGTIGLVQLDRPPVNAVNGAMYREITRFFGDVTTHLPDARVIVLSGRGRHFCGGNDLAEFQTMTAENAAERMRLVREAFFAVYDCPVPVIAAVHGVAVGTGLAIAASCDLVVAAEGARFGLPEVNVGVMGGAKHLSRLVPQGVVRRMHLQGDPVPAEELLRYGGITEIVPADQLDAAARRLARSIARHSPTVLRFAKRSLNAIEYLPLKEGYRLEQGLTGELAAYDDAKEAVNAFLERREPVYTGR
ncbi:enoyl-CoA hydratase/isomerase family protein [Pseudonocardia kongjuensis]|uniref:Enoyl-CoA hydratase/isomerase family protein n=1 Tax=Pseudonocardia kongjuensis TaxID=102227 RepID=A0ABN1XLS3_9PSEU